MSAVRCVADLTQIAADVWDTLIAQAAPGYPFLSHAWLFGLTLTGAATLETGWEPQFLLLEEAGQLVGALPLYRKTHSWGEFVFDWAWAEAYQRYGLDYYPKGVVAIPFTPVPGPRMLVTGTQVERSQRATHLRQAARDWVVTTGASGLHILFCDEQEAADWTMPSTCLRRGVQFHWHNAAYGDMDDFLAAFTRKKRKNWLQEARRAADFGVQFRVCQGDELDDADWQAVIKCYAQTYQVRGQTPYFPPYFFEHLRRRMAGQCVVVLAVLAGEIIAMAFNVVGNLPEGKVLYGRYWGALQELPCLHFVTCYHQTIAYAITHGFVRFEGGVQGQHKLARGLLPIETHSVHALADERFRAAVAAHAARESEGVAAMLAELAEHSPYQQAQ